VEAPPLRLQIWLPSISVNPTFWDVLVATVASELRATVYGIRAENDAGAFGGAPLGARCPETVVSRMDSRMVTGTVGKSRRTSWQTLFSKGIDRLQVAPDDWAVLQRGSIRGFLDVVASEHRDVGTVGSNTMWALVVVSC
jgi:hypothetical protein